MLSTWSVPLNLFEIIKCLTVYYAVIIQLITFTNKWCAHIQFAKDCGWSHVISWCQVTNTHIDKLKYRTLQEVIRTYDDRSQGQLTKCPLWHPFVPLPASFACPVVLEGKLMVKCASQNPPDSIFDGTPTKWDEVSDLKQTEIADKFMKDTLYQSCALIIYYMTINWPWPNCRLPVCGLGQKNNCGQGNDSLYLLWIYFLLISSL